MSYVSLYRKWRPQTFREVIGQNHVTQTLSNALKEDRLSHAYLFCGPRGTGKTTVARILAKALNCSKGSIAEPCNICQVCSEINADSSMDVLEIDAASNRGIEEIRSLREKIHFVPAEGRYKVYIIDEVHMLTTEAFNALLKTLEEPPSHVVFVLATTESHKVLPTILSRCQRFDFRRILVSDIVPRLKEIAEAEKIEADDGVLMMIGRNAQGSLRDAISTLDQLSSFTNKKIDLDSVIALLGTVDVDTLFEIGDIIKKRDTSKALFFVDDLVESGRDLLQLASELIEHFRHLFIIQYADKPEEIVNVTAEVLERLKVQADDFQGFELKHYIELLTATYNEMKWNPDARLLLEVALVKLTRFEVDLSLEGLLYRLEEIEKRLAGSGVSLGEVEPKPISLEATIPSPEKPFEIAEMKKVDEQKSVVAPAKEGPVKESPGKKEATRKDKRAEEEKTVDNLTAGAEGLSGPKAAEDLDEHEAEQKGPSSTETPRRAEKTAQTIELAKIKRAWPVVLEQIKKKRVPTHALFLECQPSEVIDQTVVLRFKESASFHKKEAEKPQNLSLIKHAVKDIIGLEVDVACELGEGFLREKEKQLEVAGSELAQPVFHDQGITDGPESSRQHLIKLVFDDFGAEIVDEIKLEEETS